MCAPVSSNPPWSAFFLRDDLDLTAVPDVQGVPSAEGRRHARLEGLLMFPSSFSPCKLLLLFAAFDLAPSRVDLPRESVTAVTDANPFGSDMVDVPGMEVTVFDTTKRRAHSNVYKRKRVANDGDKGWIGDYRVQLLGTEGHGVRRRIFNGYLTQKRQRYPLDASILQSLRS